MRGLGRGGEHGANVWSGRGLERIRKLHSGAVGGNGFWRGGRRGAATSIQVQEHTWPPRFLTLFQPPFHSRTRAPRMRSAAPRSTVRVPPEERVPERKSAWPAGSAENAACVTPCAAPEISAKMVSLSFRLKLSHFCMLTDRRNTLLRERCGATCKYVLSLRGHPEISSVQALNLGEERFWSSFIFL